MTATDQTSIDFYWDPASPYTYLASTQLAAFAAEHRVVFVYKPFVLGAVFKATGNAPPALIPAKGKHMMRDLGALSDMMGVPIAKPETFPLNCIPAMRCALAIDDVAAQQAFSNAVMQAHWGYGRDVTQPEVIDELAAQSGLDGAQLRERAQSDSVKAALRANTEEAIARGVFGAPTFFIGKHMFWGNDRFDLMAHVLTKGAA